MGNTQQSASIGSHTVRVKGLVAEGGYAYVYRVEDDSGTTYALKMMRIQPDNEEGKEVAQKELRTVCALDKHPNIVRYVDSGVIRTSTEDRYCILCEFCPTSVLSRLNQTKGKQASTGTSAATVLDEREILTIFRDVALAVLHLHTQDPPVAHRDLKIENVLVGRDGRYKLCDFGSVTTDHRAYKRSSEIELAKEEIRRNTTPAYRAPEQVDLHQGHMVSEKVDVWALGVMLHKLAFLRTPFEDVKGDVESLGILGGFRRDKITASQSLTFSEGLIKVMELCMVLDPASRPSCGQLLNSCEQMHQLGELQSWPGLTSLPSSPNASLQGTAEVRSKAQGDGHSDRESLPARGRDWTRSLMRKTGKDHSRSRSTTSSRPATPQQERPPRKQGDSPSSPSFMSNPETAREDGPQQGGETSGANRTESFDGARTLPCPRSPHRKWLGQERGPGGDSGTGAGWRGLVGDGVRSKWYKLLGGEQKKRLWVLKTTSRLPCGPKPKYVRQIVVALWEGALTLGGFFELLRYRPLADSSVVALKSLITLMKVLQCGPPHCLTECSTYADVIDEVGQMWTPSSAAQQSSSASPASSAGRESPSLGNSGHVNQTGAGAGNEDAEPAFSLLILRFADMMVQKIRFHQHHPEYAEYFVSPASQAESAQAMPGGRADGSEGMDLVRSMHVISRLLVVLDSILVTQKQAFLVLQRGSPEAQATTKAVLVPLVEESFLTFVATTRMLQALIAEGGEGGVVLMSLKQQYNELLEGLRVFYERASAVKEVRVMQRTPALPSTSPLDEQASADQLLRSCSRVGGCGRAPTKMDAMRTLYHEERVMQASQAASGDGASSRASRNLNLEEGDVDDDMSDEDEEEIRELQVETGWSETGGPAEEWSQLPPANGPAPPSPSPVAGQVPRRGRVRQPPGSRGESPPTPPPKPMDLLNLNCNSNSSSKPSSSDREQSEGPAPPPKPPLESLFRAGVQDFETVKHGTASPKAPIPQLEQPKPRHRPPHLIPDPTQSVTPRGASARRDGPPPPLPPRRGSHEAPLTPPPPLPPRSDGRGTPTKASGPSGHGISERNQNLENVKQIIAAQRQQARQDRVSADKMKRERHEARQKDQVGVQEGLPSPHVQPAPQQQQQQQPKKKQAAPAQQQQNPGPQPVDVVVDPSGGTVTPGAVTPQRQRSSSAQQQQQQQQPSKQAKQASPEGSLKGRIALAAYTYQAAGKEQISFTKGDVIRLHCDKINSKGWGLGEVNGKMGWFPGDFVKIQDADASPEVVSLGDTNHKQQKGGRRKRPSSSKQPQQQQPEKQGEAAEEVLPEHQFAMQMARAQPWKERLTPGGLLAYRDLLSFFSASGTVLSFDELDLKGVIGSGAFATVFKAKYRGNHPRILILGYSPAPSNWLGCWLLAAGCWLLPQTLKDFKSESALLSRLRHKNIIALVGATCDPVSVVIEYCSRGNLMVLLNDDTLKLSWPSKKQMCLDVAEGMHYLHTQNPVIIHRDLKSLNILIDENWVTKVTDFGLSRFKATSVSEKMTGQAGTYHWMAPEASALVINSQHYTEKADVFSFGIILWEIYTRAIPYDGMQPVQVVAAVLGRRERPRIPSRCPQRLAQLMQLCWHHDPNMRPSFGDIVTWLNGL
ncbi:unnamed protein product [Chrysoparadoxa australica]